MENVRMEYHFKPSKLSILNQYSPAFNWTILLFVGNNDFLATCLRNLSPG